jgi:hypothetical protein
MAKVAVRDAATRTVEKALQDQYVSKHPTAKVAVYRYNSASIRIRVLDKAFEGKDILAREEEFIPIIRSLPDDIQDQITVLLTLTPKESKRSQFSAEFDNPTPSPL